MKADRHGCCSSFALAARRGLLALALAFVWQVSHAAGGFPGFMQTVTGNSTTVKAASNGTPIVTSGVGLTPGGGWQSAGNFGVAQGAAGSVNVAGKGNLNVNGKAVPVQVNGNVSKADVASAVVSCATGGVVGCAIGALPLAAALLSSSSIRQSPTVPGGLEMAGKDTCTMGPCTKYFVGLNGWIVTGWSDSAACSATVGQPIVTQGQTVTVTGAAVFGAQCGLGYTLANGTNVAPGAGEAAGISYQSGFPPQSPTWYPTTPAAAGDEIAKQPINPLIVPELANSGVGVDKMPVGITGVTGPATVTNSTTSTVNNIDNSVRTSTTTNNYTYNGPTVTNTGATTTTTTTNAQGQTTESTTATMNPDAQPSAEEEPKDTQCDKYPNSLGCAELDTVEGTIPKSTKEVSYSAESVWGGGSCPADKTWASQTLGQSYTLVPWAKACEWAAGMRAVVLLLAAWAAFWIVMPGNTQVKPQ